MHLKPDELVDIVEGTRGESSAPHLAGCEACRRALADLRAMMSVAREVDVPEPSPLFWEQFSDRVRTAVAAEGAPHGFWRDLVSWPRVLIPMSALAAAASVIIVAGVMSRGVAPSAPPGVAALPDQAQALDGQPANDDPSLGLVAGLADNLDPDSAVEAGLTSRGSADHAVAHLSDAELRELRRLLQAALANSGT